MKIAAFLFSFICYSYILVAQPARQDVIHVDEVSRIINVLADDNMQGRKTNTPGIEKAAEFIANEFEKAGLQPEAGAKGFRQDFSMVSPKLKSQSATVNGKPVDEKKLVVISSQPSVKATHADGFVMVRIKEGENFFSVAPGYASSGKNMLVMVDESFASNFSRLSGLKRRMFQSEHHTIFILGNEDAKTWEVTATHEITQVPLSNIVGIIPGKSKKDEYVIFSAHYDHVGVGRPIEGDSIYNGANDNAAGVTAVIQLANHYKALNNNERTLVFVTFTAEESGGFGSKYFSTRYDPAKVAAMFNIEMIGTESKWGKNSAFITGFEKTDMGAILQKNLDGSGFNFYPDPYPDQQLFYRSDNATLARLGVPAHTISTAKMENEPHYHKPSDEIQTLDLENMTMIIKSIAISAASIVNGKDSPSRVNADDLR